MLNKLPFADILQRTERDRCILAAGTEIFDHLCWHRWAGTGFLSSAPATSGIDTQEDTWFMKVYRAEQIRNVALISHVGSGKTSLVDAALYDSGAVTRQGKVDEGSSISDYDPDELKRRMSLNAKVLPVEWNNTKINFIDTPGYADFAGRSQSSPACGRRGARRRDGRKRR